MKRLIARLGLVLIVATPLAANAIIVKVNYTGTVDIIGGGSVLGYAVGDSISGTMFIDTDLLGSSTSSSTSNVNLTNYESSNPLFVVGGQLGIGDQLANGLDLAQVANSTASGGVDQYFVANGSHEPQADLEHYIYQGVVVFDYVLDFVNGTGLDQSFSLVSTDLNPGGLMRGFIYDRFTDPITQFDDPNKYALFSLSSISVAPKSVPEPGTLSLLGAGLVGLFFLRRRRAAA